MNSFRKDQIARIKWAIFSFFFLQGLCFASWASRIPDIKSTLGLNDVSWGTVLLMIPLGQICAMWLSGILISKYGSKLMLLFSMPLYGLILISIGFANTKIFLVTTLILFGIIANLCNLSVNAQGITVEYHYKKPIMSTFHGGWSLAGLFGATIGLIMTWCSISPLYHFILIFVFVLLGILGNYKYLQTDVKKDQNLENVGKISNKPEMFLLLLGCIGFCGMAAEGAMTDWCGIYLQDVVETKDSLAPLGLTCYMITMAIGRLIMDRITQRYGRKKVLKLCGCCIFGGLSLTVLFPTFPITLFSFMIIGFGTSGIVPTVYSVAGEKTKISTGMALTIVTSISFLGFLLGPPLIGYVSYLTNLRYSYAIIGLCGISIIILSSIARILKNE